MGGGVWECAVQYVKIESDSQFTFDTGGGTQHISQAIETINRYPAPGEIAPDFQGAVGVNQDQIEGTDITVPVYNFTETHYIDDVLVTGAYKATLFFLTGRVNDAGLKGFAKGEVLFLGGTGSFGVERRGGVLLQRPLKWYTLVERRCWRHAFPRHAIRRRQ